MTYRRLKLTEGTLAHEILYHGAELSAPSRRHCQNSSILTGAENLTYKRAREHERSGSTAGQAPCAGSGASVRIQDLILQLLSDPVGWQIVIQLHHTCRSSAGRGGSARGAGAEGAVQEEASDYYERGDAQQKDRQSTG